MPKHHPHQLYAVLRGVLLALLLAVPASTLTSCGDDEPDLMVGYYLGIQSQVRLILNEEDESQGTSASPVQDMLSTTIVRMREALRTAYPMANNHGNDAHVISALDRIYMDYKSMYGGSERNTVCVVKLYRTRMDGDIVKKSKTLKAYHFGAIPPGSDESSL